MNRMLLSQMLNSQFDTAEAASGEDCLRLLEQNPTGISVVLLDIHMTGIDGFTVLEAMSQRGMLEEIPVIMISSEDNVDTVRRAFDLGCVRLYQAAPLMQGWCISALPTPSACMQSSAA